MLSRTPRVMRSSCGPGTPMIISWPILCSSFIGDDNSLPLILKQRLQIRVVRLARNSEVGDDRGNVTMRRDVKGRIRNRDALWRDLLSTKVRDLIVSPIFNRNLFSSVQREVNRRKGRRDVKWYVVFVRGDCDHVRADLVSHVSVCRNSVRSDDDRIDNS